MKVNENISAVISNAHLHRTENNLTASIERLSSGFKINKAKDNPSGMAISNKMRAQINALNQSSRNASDGISVIQTADGAMNEVHSILQRMRELSVQAATDSLTPEDKKACQAEFEQLGQEIDRIARDTEFNAKSIIDGSQDRRIYSSEDGIGNFHTSDSVAAGDYEFTLTKLPEQAKAYIGAVPTGTVTLNGYTVELTGDDQTRLGQLRDAAETVGITIEEGAGSGYDLTTIGYGTNQFIEMIVNDTTELKADEHRGVNAEVKLADGFSGTASWTSNGAKVTVNDKNGFEMTFKVDPLNMRELKSTTPLPNGQPDWDEPKLPAENIKLEVTDIGTMDLQIGAHEAQEINVRIPSVTTEALYIDDLNLVRKEGASRAIAALDEAIALVSETRSRVGAYQNRLEYAQGSLNETEEDMEAAISRILDTDMAEEMANYSNQQVLDQAAISVLTQANDMPQQVLQLLQ